MTSKEDTREIYLEIGQKKVFAVSANWPGWARSGRDESSAIQALCKSAPRYLKAITSTGLEFHSPESSSAFIIMDRLKGNATTDFGASDALFPNDWHPIEDKKLERSKVILNSCWNALNQAIAAAQGKTLKKGPRGGGRDLIKIIHHVMEAEEGYLRVLGYKRVGIENASIDERKFQLREEVLQGLDLAISGHISREGPRGGKRWSPGFFIRRVAWHALDHAWEIEDRILSD